MRCFNSSNKIVKNYATLVVINRYPIQAFSYLNKVSINRISSDNKKQDDFLALISIIHPDYYQRNSKKTNALKINNIRKRILEIGISGSFEGGSSYLGIQ